ncbi:hypothetical protein WA158_000143 [Blastocystis sp. Blastoise]
MASVLKCALPLCMKATNAFKVSTCYRTFALRKNIVPPHADNAHRSDAEWRISQVPVIEVDKPVVMCDGGAGVMGHPVQYLRVNGPTDKPTTCPYCGLRYKMKAGTHSH